MKLEDLTIQEFMTALGAKTPTPGGGATASITAALAAALARMVVNYSVGKKSLADHEAVNQQALTTLAEQCQRALHLAEADAKAYGALNELWRLDKDDPRRVEAFPAAVKNAIEPPSGVLTLALEMLQLMQTLTGTTNRLLKSDLAMAAVLAEAAARSAAWNVRINLPLLDDEKAREQWRVTLEDSIEQAKSLADSIERACM